MCDTLGDLFDKLSAFLSQFRICQRIKQYSNIDTTLNITINELLVSFVDICGLSIDVWYLRKVESYNTVKYAKYWKLARGDPRLHFIERRRCKGRSGPLRNRQGECKESPSSRQPLCADFRRDMGKDTVP
jgi:hypothetical protein